MESDAGMETEPSIIFAARRIAKQSVAIAYLYKYLLFKPTFAIFIVGKDNLKI
ncbi:hypothetical protein SDC9_200793 [bioreactor metagenome]|uniref:Uncharacterized protein n=1 Tax=bioreactor metagenome TaxID=1076179 RepID=A0A645IRY1_9ZZZZ